MIDIDQEIENLKRANPKLMSCILHMLFEFEQEEDCENFFKPIYHPNDIDQLIFPHSEKGKYLAGFNSDTSTDPLKINYTVKVYSDMCRENNGILKECSLNAANT